MIQVILLVKVVLKKMVHKYFKVIANTDYVSSWKSKGLSTPPTTSDNSLAPALSYYGIKTKVKFNGSCLKRTT